MSRGWTWSVPGPAPRSAERMAPPPTARKQALASMFFGKRPAVPVRTNFPDMSRQRE